MRLADRTRQPRRRLRRRHEVDVIGHEAIRPRLDRGLAAALGQQVAIERVIGRLEKNLLATVAALRHVMGKARNDDTADARHAVYRAVLEKSVQWVRCHGNSRQEGTASAL